MLVLQRKPGESIVLSSSTWSEDITISLSANQPNDLKKVRLAIQAPRSVLIARSELLPFRPKQGEKRETPDIWLKADRETARDLAPKFSQEYIDKLEAIARVADRYWSAMSGKIHTPEQHQISEDLLNALAGINFVAEYDTIEEEEMAHVS